ncbi:group II intron maturase-specific domain-containing protein [Streptomyces mirabilis]
MTANIKIKTLRRVTHARVTHCVGGVLSPLLANIALSVLDEYICGPWEPEGAMSTPRRRSTLRAKGQPTWRIVRYADDFVVLVNGCEEHVHEVREEVAQVLRTMGLRLAPAKTQIVHMSEGFDFLGFHIQWRRKRGTNTWHVYTFIADRPIRRLKAKIRALTRKTSSLDLDAVLAQLNMAMGGWAFYFQHAIAKRVFSKLDSFTWWRVTRLLRERHRWSWKELRRRHTTPTGQWLPFSANGVELRNIEKIPVTRYLYRGNKIPNPWVHGAH